MKNKILKLIIKQLTDNNKALKKQLKRSLIQESILDKTIEENIVTSSKEVKNLKSLIDQKDRECQVLHDKLKEVNTPPSEKYVNSDVGMFKGEITSFNGDKAFKKSNDFVVDNHKEVICLINYEHFKKQKRYPIKHLVYLGCYIEDGISTRLSLDDALKLKNQIGCNIFKEVEN